jgi:hypothetical protein
MKGLMRVVACGGRGGAGAGRRRGRREGCEVRRRGGAGGGGAGGLRRARARARATHLVVGGPEAPVHVLVVQHRDLKGKVLLEVLDDEHQVRQLDAQHLLGLCGARHVRGGHVGAADLEHAGLNVAVRDALDVAILDLLVPDLQRLGADAKEDGQEAGLVGAAARARGEGGVRSEAVGGRGARQPLGSSAATHRNMASECAARREEN